VISRWVTSLLTASVAAGATHALPAQGATATVRINLPVTDLITRLHVSTAESEFGTVGFDNLMAGWSETEGPVLSVKSNRQFVVSIAAATGTFGPAGKSSSDVSWAVTPGGPYTSLTPGGATALAVVAGGLASQPLFFRIAWNLEEDPPGLYLLDVMFTISAP
jgi:hypothetical protein